MRAGIHLGRTKGLIHTAMTVGAETFAEHITRRPAATGDTAEATRRGAQLDALLGDPHAPANPHGLTNLLAADARHRPPGRPNGSSRGPGSAPSSYPSHTAAD